MMRHAALACALLALGACSMIPELPELNWPLPDQYPAGPAYDEALVRPELSASESAHLAEIAWSNYFRDPVLLDLIDKGLARNRSYQQAALDVAAARAQYGIERSAYFPEIEGQAAYTRQDSPAAASGGRSGQAVGPGSGGAVEYYTASVGVTAYELDFFGRIRSLNEAALNRFLASKEAREAIRISLIADIAGAYTMLKAEQALLALSESTIETQHEALQLIRLRLDSGIANELELRQAQILLEQANADKVALQRAIAQDRNSLRLLLGTPEEGLPSFPGGPAVSALDTIAPLLPVDLPSAALVSRPDIRQAEFELVAANADIGAARAAFLPRITLTAAGGYQSAELAGLFSSSNAFWQFSPSVTLPIFTWGRLSKSLDLAEIRSESAVLSYEQTIETAFRETADALAAASTYDDQIRAQQRLIKASKEAVELSEMRYQEGVESYLSVLDARREMYHAQQAYLRLKAQEVGARIQLYKAVGGGPPGHDRVQE